MPKPFPVRVFYVGDLLQHGEPGSLALSTASRAEVHRDRVHTAIDLHRHHVDDQVRVEDPVLGQGRRPRRRCVRAVVVIVESFLLFGF